MRLKCHTCAGEYVDILSDGTRYFHVCPPATLVAVRRGLQDLEVPLADVRPTDLVTVARDGTAAQVLVAELLEGDERQGDRQVHRGADHRDENTLRRDGARGERRVLKAPGKGAVDLDSGRAIPADDDRTR